ncbi:hypothetical protein [Phaffia rhodozyma]|uniref:Uncharacterized protein n=1 Tax=Phaffia rhodozyma TaxID=264483 RepID=A0A0F7SKT9_PHARH|nr:hypothetical protein [Phaffia rhodozyma]
MTDKQPSSSNDIEAPPTAAQLAAFQARADLSVVMLRNMMGKMVKGWVPPTAEELNQTDPQVKPNATRKLINKLVPRSSAASSSTLAPSSSATTSFEQHQQSQQNNKRYRSSAVANLINQPAPSEKNTTNGTSNGNGNGTGSKRPGRDNQDSDSDEDEAESRSRAVGKKAKLSNTGIDQFGGKNKKKKKQLQQQQVPPPPSSTAVATDKGAGNKSKDTEPGPESRPEQEQINPFRLFASPKTSLPKPNTAPKPPSSSTSISTPASATVAVSKPASIPASSMFSLGQRFRTW